MSTSEERLQQIRTIECTRCRCAASGYSYEISGGYCSSCVLDLLKESPQIDRLLPDIPGTDPVPIAQRRIRITLCQRCGGSGTYLASIGQKTGNECYGCLGFGWVATQRSATKRTAAWWETYQQNRIPQ